MKLFKIRKEAIMPLIFCIIYFSEIIFVLVRGELRKKSLNENQEMIGARITKKNYRKQYSIWRYHYTYTIDNVEYTSFSDSYDRSGDFRDSILIGYDRTNPTVTKILKFGFSNEKEPGSEQLKRILKERANKPVN